jgi:GTP-binding protein Era
VRSGFAAVVGRPNVGKSTLCNRLCGEKVSIVAATPNTTRHAVRGVVHRDGAQLVVVDTPGVHRPKTALGERLNDAARAAVDDVDALVALVDATAPVGPGDRRVLAQVLATSGATGPQPFVVVNKADAARRPTVAARLLEAESVVAALGGEAAGRVEYFAVSAVTGAGVDPLLDAVFDVLPEGPAWYPAGTVVEADAAERAAELVREALLARVRDELPHAIHTRVASAEWPVVSVEILVERESQKGIVIGRGGRVLKEVGTEARAQLPEGCFLELRVSVEEGWQSRGDVLDRWGY